MLKIFNTYLLLSMSFNSFSQSLKVLDSKTNLPIAYTTIRNITNLKATYTDSFGKFNFQMNKTDSLLISSVGYKTVVVKAESIVNNTIFMEQFVHELTEVTVKNWKVIKTTEVGEVGRKSNVTWGPGGGAFGFEIAQRVDISTEINYYKLKTIKVPTKGSNVNSPALLHIYSMDSITKMPFEEILHNKILITENNKRKGIITINVEAENIVLNDKAFFISIKWLPFINGKPEYVTKFAMNRSATNKEYTFSRVNFKNNSDWRVIKIQFFKEQEVSVFNGLFSATIDILK